MPEAVYEIVDRDRITDHRSNKRYLFKPGFTFNHPPRDP